jgi:hypothetical protein
MRLGYSENLPLKESGESAWLSASREAPESCSLSALFTIFLLQFLFGALQREQNSSLVNFFPCFLLF